MESPSTQTSTRTLRGGGSIESAAPALRGARAFWAACAGLASFVLVVARVLSPDPSGFGTHTQLGLPACFFLQLTSLPCPACGLTTSFAHMARLQITSALHANVLGLPLFVITALAVPYSVYACARALPILPTLELLRVSRVAAIICVAALIAWIARVAAILA
jgi:hypothetical protein